MISNLIHCFSYGISKFLKWPKCIRRAGDSEQGNTFVTVDAIKELREKMTFCIVN